MKLTIQKKILKNFTVNKEFSEMASRANQYFLPETKGYITDFEPCKVLNELDLGNVPDSLKNGLVINTFTTMRPYLLPDIEGLISKALEIPVRIEYNVCPADYSDNFLKERSHDAFLMARSMSDKVIGEAINIVYVSNNPPYLDPTGNIKELMNKYMSTDNQREQECCIYKILEQMIYDSECIPLNYMVNAMFYNSDEIDISKSSIDESIKLWKIKVKWSLNTNNYLLLNYIGDKDEEKTFREDTETTPNSSY